MIVEAQSDSYTYSFLTPRSPQLAQLTQFGILRKMIIAARFNIMIPVGWPELQIIRNANNGTSYVAFTTNTTEPKPTGYLSVYEYNLTGTEFNIQDGDKLNISWHHDGDVLQQDLLRFSLAYYNNGTSPSIPMVSIVVGDNGSETDLLTLSTVRYCEEDNESNAKARITTTDVATICGVVFFSLLLTILLILVVISVIMVRRRRKSASINTVNSTGINRYVNEAQPFHGTAGIVIVLAFILIL